MSEVCKICGLLKELCICEEIAKQQQKIKIYHEKRRYGKAVTIIDGIDLSQTNINQLLKTLKMHCASGGTVKNNKIELQGMHYEKIKKILDEKGYQVEVI